MNYLKLIVKHIPLIMAFQVIHSPLHFLPALQAADDFGNLKETDKHLTSVQIQVKSMNVMLQPKLVLGVDATEEGILNRFDESYVFLNESQKQPTNPRAITTNFNDLERLQNLATYFPQTFEIIALDDSTFKFTSWTVEHLQSFKAMLRPNGQFIFGPFIGGTGLRDNSYASWQQLTEELRKEVFPSQKLITIFTLPYQMPTPPNPQDYEEEVNSIFNKQMQLKGLSRKEVMKKAQELGLISWFPEGVLNDAQKLRSQIGNKVYHEAFCKYFFKEIIVPNNYRKIMAEVFGQENIQVEYNKPLPFESRYNKHQSVLVIATKK